MCLTNIPQGITWNISVEVRQMRSKVTQHLLRVSSFVTTCEESLKDCTKKSTKWILTSSLHLVIHPSGHYVVLQGFPNYVVVPGNQPEVFKVSRSSRPTILPPSFANGNSGLSRL